MKTFIQYLNENLSSLRFSDARVQALYDFLMASGYYDDPIEILEIQTKLKLSPQQIQKALDLINSRMNAVDPTGGHEFSYNPKDGTVTPSNIDI